MIKLFVVDLDGCITFPFEQPHWPSIEKIRAYNAKALAGDPAYPALSICTGRPQPYAECVAQWLGIQKPFVFESGGGIYDMQKNELFFNPAIKEHHFQQIDTLKKWVSKELLPGYKGSIPEFAKVTDCGIIHPEVAVIDKMLVEVEQKIADLGYDDFEIHHTDVSINIILKECNKARGLHNLGNILDIKPSEMAYIGDSGGDVEALKIAGRAFCPSNSRDIVKEIKNVEVLAPEATEAVSLAYEMISIK